MVTGFFTHEAAWRQRADQVVLPNTCHRLARIHHGVLNTQPRGLTDFASLNQ